MDSNYDSRAQKAFVALYPSKKIPEITLSFSKKFKPYNGNIRQYGSKIELHLSFEFKQCEDEIIIGIIQYLLNKLYSTSIDTFEQDLYTSFLKHIPRYTKKAQNDSLLITLFNDLNEEYFNNTLERPNLVFGKHSTTTLGHYSFITDTVTISRALQKRTDLVKYVLYHELLHKKHSYKKTKQRTMYHTTEFRRDEKKYKDQDIEQKLTAFLQAKKTKSLQSSLYTYFHKRRKRKTR